MRTVCEKNSCTGCMACIGKCNRNAITIEDCLYAYNAVIDKDKCVDCGRCKNVCPNNSLIDKYKPMTWYEGWGQDDIRANSSSGGIAYSLMKRFIEDGGYVASCMFDKGEFNFKITNNAEEIRKFVGSKYVKSNPLGIYEKISCKLKNDNRVLFIGLPCQVAGLKKYVCELSSEKIEKLYTVDLICHGTPSPKMLNMALKEKKIEIANLKNIGFRNNNMYNLYLETEEGYKKFTRESVQDMYTYAFLKALDYTENCYSCKYATFERVADITIGDSWGSDLSQGEIQKGISLILCQNEHGLELINNSEIELKEVDIEKAIKFNKQLQHPAVIPMNRTYFFKNINKGFYKAMARSSTKVYYKQKIKELLLRFKDI